MPSHRTPGPPAGTAADAPASLAGDDGSLPATDEQWRQRLDVDVSVTVDHADALWHGNVGVVPALIARTVFDPKNAVALVCGPEVMMRFTVSALREAGVPDGRVYLSMERNMKCAAGLCGHCQFGPELLCMTGPVMPFDRIASLFSTREI